MRARWDGLRSQVRDSRIAEFLRTEPGPVKPPPLVSGGMRAPIEDYDRVARFLSDSEAPTSALDEGHTAVSDPVCAPRRPAGETIRARAVVYAGKLSEQETRVGDDYVPPEEAAQAEAHNEILQALASGAYRSIENFWADLNSICEWTNPTWNDPLPPPRPPPCTGWFVPPNPSRCNDWPWIDGCEAPCINPEGCDPEQLPFDLASGKYDLKVRKGIGDAWYDAYYDQDAELVQLAWALLLDNRDIVEWVACMYYGEMETPDALFGTPTSLASCLISKIEGGSPDVTILLDYTRTGWVTFAGTHIDGGRIRIGTAAVSSSNRSFHGAYRTNYGSTPGGYEPTDAQNFCIIADLAATLLHELVHSCVHSGQRDSPGGVFNSDLQGQCSTSYLIENAFRWSLGLRYPCLVDPAENTHCCFYDNAALWGNDFGAYPGLPPFGIEPSCMPY